LNQRKKSIITDCYVTFWLVGADSIGLS